MDALVRYGGGAEESRLLCASFRGGHLGPQNNKKDSPSRESFPKSAHAEELFNFLEEAFVFIQRHERHRFAQNAAGDVAVGHRGPR